jgi:signal-transduction protein with cAMP-binding, CBS, and nucleotidyltransferase domain
MSILGIASMVRKISIDKASTHPLITAGPDDTLGGIYEKLCHHNSVVVVDTSGQFQGIVSRKDAVEVILTRSDWEDVVVGEIMTQKVLYIPNHVALAEAAETMLQADIHQLVVVGPPEGGSVAIGIITLQDVLCHLTTGKNQRHQA